jgi:hypothetical protein
MCELTAEYVRGILDYDPSTGVFAWRGVHARCVRAGRIAGRINGKGYATISIRNKQRQAHRLAWLYVYGVWPDRTVHVDHINGNKSDNRIVNLRLATPAQNAQNRRKAIDGLKGATLHRRLGKWQAQITFEGKVLYLGLFSKETEAHDAYVSAARKYFGEFACNGVPESEHAL